MTKIRPRKGRQTKGYFFRKGRKWVASKQGRMIPLEIDQWLNAYKGWKGCWRTRIQDVKRAVNYAVEKGLIPTNPIRGYKTPKLRFSCSASGLRHTIAVIRYPVMPLRNHDFPFSEERHP
ncbi:MAG: hypothetical protein GXY83_39050 [Rhodopirellula sp.]|nr:hypothetical protein [Rhodopirellula sp.]